MLKSLAAVIAIALPIGAHAEAWKDYTPQKSALEVTLIAVNPNHLDDYLSALGKDLVPCFEKMKETGEIDNWGVTQKLNSNSGANVMIWTHWPSIAAMEPQHDRDVQIMKACQPNTSPDTWDKFDKWRTFVSDEIYMEVEYPK